ncbi:hypothetical protein SPBRAN_169 [uncultured Candidatus Thioglobus sp.]|nr:hypothetical protein SPBRAN_169 [uncultured Candidatus Thioglobus sp.]
MMKEIYFQLNSLTVLTGISIAIIQYLFTNHQNTLKGILSNLKNIEFAKDNDVDNELEAKWEDAIRNCKEHNYFIDPNKLIGMGFLIILCTAFLFDFILFEFYLDSGNILKSFAIIFTLFLIAGSFLIYQIFSKESSIKKEFKNIESQHNMVEKVLASRQS